MPESQTPEPRSWRRWIKPVMLAAAAAAAVWIIGGLAQRVSWSAVGDALATLDWWQMPVLVVALVGRQVLSSTPVARFVTGLGLKRAIHNEMSANLVATVAPPPSDMALRVAMFRSWGVDPVDGMAGVTLATVVFWGARFLAPVLGLAMFAVRGIETRQWAIAGVSAAIAATILVTLILVLRSHTWAEATGRMAARAVSRVGRPADEAGWASAVLEFRARVESSLRRHLFPALVLMLAGVAVESFILLASLRFVGVPQSLPSVEIVGTFLLLYPLTILPMLGLGVLDAILVATWVDNVAASVEPTLV
ncbi:hypothetical protein, partial [Demequina sp.]|uniref:hypothetical protein n=1 Tax=Demequina sp. TaxID=2050685 RepID=UPI0025D5276C